jgi:hypothetical protein
MMRENKRRIINPNGITLIKALSIDGAFFYFNESELAQAS